MIVPKKKMSKMRSRTRRAHDFLTPTFAIVCPNCGEATLRHRACPDCGFYRGKHLLKGKQDYVADKTA